MAAISACDMLKIGVGPSSSHTLGPWRAAQQAVRRWRELGVFGRTTEVRVDLYGSLAKTGRGHMTDMAVMPRPLEPRGPGALRHINASRQDRGDPPVADAHARWGPPGPLRSRLSLPIQLPGEPPPASQGPDVHRDTGQRLERRGDVLLRGGGFIVQDGESDEGGASVALPFPIESAKDLLGYCSVHVAEC